jgi:acetyl-CoA acyltransferase
MTRDQQDIYVAGTGMTVFGRQLDRSLRSLTEEAVRDALSDAGAEPAMVDQAFFANVAAGPITGQGSVPGQVALRHTGLLGIPIVNVENACASGSTAVSLACNALAAGAAEVVIVVGAEKLTHTDKARTFAAFSGAYDQDEPPSVTHDRGDGAAARSVFMDVYAGVAREYMRRAGAKPQDFAAVAVKAQGHGMLNPKAQYGMGITAEQVLESRLIIDPLTMLMCSPISDGAAALVLATERGLQRMQRSNGSNSSPGAPTPRVRVLAATIVSGRDRSPGELTAPERAARIAYDVAGITPSDIDVVELHDAAAPAELIVTEELGLCEPGEGPELLRSGATTLGGRIPVNPSGGLLSKGHPVGATGVAQLVELTEQLRGRCGERQVPDARIALAENGGGYLENDPAVATVTILARV